MTLTPDTVTPADAAAVRAAGASDEAIEHALYVGFVFGMFNRVANALGFHAPVDAESYRTAAGVLLRIGYR